MGRVTLHCLPHRALRAQPSLSATVPNAVTGVAHLVNPKRSHGAGERLPCRDVWLRLREVDPSGNHLPDPMTFEVRVGLEHWIEREPPERSGKTAALVRELLVEFPTEAIEELVEAFKQQRATQANRRIPIGYC